MTHYTANYTKAQMKIQQMAFLLVAITVFFAMIALIYFSLSLSGLRGSATQLQDEEARALVRKLSGSAEFAFTSSSDCSSCIDLDRALALKEKKDDFETLWNLDHLFIERLSPTYPEGECTTSILGNYPNDCNKITILNKTSNYATKTAFVTLVRWEPSLNGGAGGYKYEFGRIHASPKEIK